MTCWFDFCSLVLSDVTQKKRKEKEIKPTTFSQFQIMSFSHCPINCIDLFFPPIDSQKKEKKTVKKLSQNAFALKTQTFVRYISNLRRDSYHSNIRLFSWEMSFLHKMPIIIRNIFNGNNIIHLFMQISYAITVSTSLQHQPTTTTKNCIFPQKWNAKLFTNIMTFGLLLSVLKQGQTGSHHHHRLLK